MRAVQHSYLLLALGLTLPLETHGAAPSFIPLGFLPERNDSCSAVAVSADGSTVVGECQEAPGSELPPNFYNIEAFSWTSSGGMIGLGQGEPNQIGYPESHATAVSADGSVVVGSAINPATNRYEPVRWVGGSMTFLNDLPPGFNVSLSAWATAISDDGATVVGSAYFDTDPNAYPGHDPGAFLWRNSELIRIGSPGDAAMPRSVSADGSVVVGGSSDCGNAFRWTSDDGFFCLGLLPGPYADGTYAVATSADGTTIVGWSTPTGTPFRWTAEGGMMALDTVDEGSFIQAWSASDDGSIIVGGSNNPFIWDSFHGMRSVTQLLAESGIDLTGWTLLDVIDVSADGQTIIGNGLNPNGLIEPWLAVIPKPSDRDADGIPDDAEEIGCIDLNHDHTCNPLDDVLLPGADPDQKDIFIEVDVLQRATLIDDALRDVEAAFPEAPNAGNPAPNEQRGIQLHLIKDDTDLALSSGGQNWALPPAGVCGPLHSPDMAHFRSTRFGTAQERLIPGAVERKKRVFRYLVFGGRWPGGPSGVADPWGPTAVVSLEGFSGGPDASRDWQAGTIMHELGHTLGLTHGGGDGDHIVYKPNYHSVMNYTWQFRAHAMLDAVFHNAFAASWRLDYSRSALNTLPESSLSETEGIGGTSDTWVLAGPMRPCIDNPSTQCARVVNEAGPVDWDEDRQIALPPASAAPRDINHVRSSSDPSPSQTLLGFDDWTFVSANLASSYSHPNWDDGSSQGSCSNWGSPEDLHDMTHEEVNELLDQELFIDCNRNGIADQRDAADGLDVDTNENGILDRCEPLTGDIDLDRDIDETDRQLLLAAFGHVVGEPQFLRAADLDGDDAVTFVDYQRWVIAYDAFLAARRPPATACGLGGLEVITVLSSVLVLRRVRGRS